jgi:FdhD protein
MRHERRRNVPGDDARHESTARTTRRVSIRRVDAAAPPASSSPDEPSFDRVAVESPLQVLLDDEPFAVIMRTPGDDEALVVGFLHAEGVVSAWRDVARLATSRDAEGRAAVAVRLAAGVPAPSRGERRQVDVNAACGMCGRVRVESLAIDRAPLVVGWRVDAAVVAALPGRLRAEQHVFDETGGLHAAGVFDRHGALIAAAEDVGRHNAVDKVIGRLLMRGMLPLGDALLAVSGRLAYEIVQKAFLAGIPLVAAVSAPSSLAVALAEQAGVTLAGFVRGHGFNIYAHGERITEVRAEGRGTVGQ